MKTKKKKRSADPRNKVISANLTISEYEKLENKLKTTTCQSMSEYVRKAALRQPVVVYYRDQSVDEFLPVALAIKNSLNEALLMFEEAMHALREQPALGNNLEFFEASHFALSQKVEEIRATLLKIHQSCIQK